MDNFFIIFKSNLYLIFQNRCNTLRLYAPTTLNSVQSEFHTTEHYELFVD